MDARTSILTRLYVVITLLALLPAAVAVQLVMIYLGEGSELREQGARQASATIPIQAVRGPILDRAGRTLAMNTSRYEVAVDPTIQGFAGRSDALFAELARQTGRPASEFRRRVAQSSSPRYALLASNVEESAKEAIEALSVPGVILTARTARRYTYGRVGSHILGHVDSDLRGIAGIEGHYDQFLAGREGRQVVHRDRRGILRPVVDGVMDDPHHGQELQLTIDLVLQSILQEELSRGVAETAATWGTAIAMDPHTGAILAMANAPDYDPNRAGAFPESARRNHAITDQIEPGSTFKLVTAVAAMETGAISPRDTIDTGAGWAVFGGRTMRDTRSHGKLTFADAITVSSNVAFARVGTQVERGAFYQYVRNLGFGQPTMIDLPGEESGRIHRPDTWSGSTQSSMSIGYAVTATPLQLLTAYAALANGGLLVRPHVLAERRDLATGRVLWTAPKDSVRRAFRPATADTLRAIFESVVSNDGTARRAMVDGLRIAGKTGTARIAEGGRYVSAYRGSFVGVFPAEAPEVALLVILDRPVHGYYGGAVAAPIFGRIAERWTGVQPALAGRRGDGPIAERAPAHVPDVRGVPGRIASGRLLASGMLPTGADRLDDAWRSVSSQRPEAGEEAPPRRTVRLATLRQDQVSLSMPDVRGLSARHATSWLLSLGVVPTIRCGGTITSQTPGPGEDLAEHATISCT